VETSAALVKLDGTRNATITAILTRQNGSVSIGTRVTFEAFQQGQSAGRFFGVGTTDANGRATATFSADANAMAGQIRIVATTQTDSGGNLSSELTLTAS
jgi:5-hydroxyisourate hydrolase-like protein (transthyretin family)